MCAVCLDNGQVTIEMGRSGISSSANNQTDAVNTTMKVLGPLDTSYTITVHGGNGGGNSSYYGCGGVRSDYGSTSNSWRNVTLNNAHVITQLGSYSGGNGTTRPNSESAYDRDS